MKNYHITTNSINVSIEGLNIADRKFGNSIECWKGAQNENLKTISFPFHSFFF